METQSPEPSRGIRFLDANLGAPSALDIVLALFLGAAMIAVARRIFDGQPTPSFLYAGIAFGVLLACSGLSPTKAPKAFAAVIAAVLVVAGVVVALLPA